MSKKNLARTAIEGGRYGYNKWERRNSNRVQRAAERNFLSKVEKDVENYDDLDIKPREKVYKSFKDKLNPMYRWLHAQVGRKWDDVKSDVFTKFDTRTTAGRHITYDHLLRSVEEVPDLRYGRKVPTYEEWITSRWSENEFFVDGDGYLRNKTYIPYKTRVPRIDTNKLANWLNGRVVGYVGDKLFWFVPADKNRKYGGRKRKWATIWGYPPGGRSYYSRYGLYYIYLSSEPIYKKDARGDYVRNEKGRLIIESTKEVWRDATPAFRQDRKLNAKELAFWNTIPEYYQKVALKYSPTYVKTAEDIAEEKRHYY